MNMFANGDFVKIEYSMYRLSDNALVRTTDKAAAEKGGIYSSEAKYAPQLVVMGKGMLFDKLEEAIGGMKAGESKEVELDAKDAYGERSKDLVRIMPLADFRKRDINPQPGMQIEIDDSVATVMSVNSGRVMVDANHPLAGERLKYQLKVVEKIEKDEDKIKALEDMNEIKADKASIEKESGIVRINFGTAIKKDANYFVRKSGLVYSILDYMDGIKRVVVEEEHSREEKGTA